MSCAGYMITRRGAYNLPQKTSKTKINCMILLMQNAFLFPFLLLCSKPLQIIYLLIIICFYIYINSVIEGYNSEWTFL